MTKQYAPCNRHNTHHATGLHFEDLSDIESVWGVLERGYHGAYHQFSKKHKELIK